MERTHTPMDPSHASLAEALVSTLQVKGPLTMEQLLNVFPDKTWWQFFEVIDSLSRAGHIAIHTTGFRDYRISLPRHAA